MRHTSVRPIGWRSVYASIPPLFRQITLLFRFAGTRIELYGTLLLGLAQILLPFFVCGVLPLKKIVGHNLSVLIAKVGLFDEINKSKGNNHIK